MFIQDNIDNPAFSAEKFANLLNLSRSQLHRKLKRLTGMSTTDFIRQQRLKLAAKLLLEETEKSITEVAFQSGFVNMSYFSKCFKEKYGCTPSDYIKKQNSKKT